MNLTNEQIREFFENPEKLKETFPEVFNKMKVGEWYKFNNLLVYITDNSNPDSHKGYGFYSGEWFDTIDTSEHLGDSKGYVKATEEEVQEALIKEAKRRYPIGCEVVSLIGTREAIDDSNKFFSYANFDELYMCGLLVFEKGKWAEIVEQPTTYSDLESKVLQWAKDKGILDKATPMTQALKTLEEVNELLTAINNDNKGEIEDALGDILVTLIIGAELNGLKLTDCLQSAYLEIKDRKGKMVNGTFVKE